MDYSATLDYLFKQLPMYQRVGSAAYKVDLNNTYQLCEILNQPQNKFKTVHVAGTNGKGSTSHMLASVLQEAGHKVGLYTSPHLKDFRERIKINGIEIPQQTVIDFVNKYKANFEAINLSFFEWTVGLAFYYFAEQQVDIAIIETGLGGRLDSTNVINPLLAIITNIGLDHTQFLGNTLEKIANEKGGIIKPNTPVIIGETQKKTEAIFIEIANKVNAPIYFADKKYHPLYKCDLLGQYQKKNIITCLQSIEILNQLGWKISEKYIEQGLKNVIKNTSLLGRWQTISENPLIICDTAHNFSGLSIVLQQLKALNKNTIHIVLGTVNDKSVDEILALFPKNAKYYFCQANIPRALAVDKLHILGQQHGLKGEAYNTVNEALKNAKANYTTNDVIFVGGSTFVVAEVLV